ncbi:CoA-acylating methylmalonate-semialdehyde dehydrogenase [Aliikangiella maris]|uniref:methylmalonate-semialdehyde dehydrogenase (CoA acylating) n=2 Tax=Aliikangiella maris TaxID=3162458 RepID=A0ABV2BWH3_9GAMM
MQTIGHFIQGKIHLNLEQNKLPVFNPAIGEQVSQVIIADEHQIQSTIKTAQQAFALWSLTSPAKRARVLFKFRELLEKNLERLAGIITQEHGKTFADAKAEVIRGLEVIEFSCGISSQLGGQFSDNVSTQVDCTGFRQPIGVCLGITPFNFPVMVPLWMIPVAIACGNCMILKPSEKVPSASLVLAELLQQAGLPNGVFNVLQGDHTTVKHLLAHPEISAVSFVGSTHVAQSIYQQATLSNKRVQALGGAKNHLVVMPDASQHEVADALIGAAFGSAGERCMAISVAVVIGEDNANTLSKILVDKINQLKVAPGDQSDTDMGPLITAEHLNKVKNYIQSGVEQGAKLVVDGRQKTFAPTNTGFFIGATLFDEVTSDMSIYQEEIFGPVLCLVRVNDLDEAITLINQHQYANGTSIYTQSGQAARHFSRNIHVGMVGINVAIPVPVAFHSFGGWKSSLFGDHHIHGEEGVRFYTRLKTVTSRWQTAGIASSEEHSAFIMPTSR